MAYTDDAVKAKLSALNETQESIVTVAQWVMFHRRHADKTGALWLQRLKDSGAGKRLNLIYLANGQWIHQLISTVHTEVVRWEEVAQQSKARKKDDFLIAFSPIIAEATATAYKGATNEVQQKLRRVVEVWRQRLIFEPPIQEAIEARINEIDKSRSSGKKPLLGGSLFTSSSGPSAPVELQPIATLQIAVSKATLAASSTASTANVEYEKLMDPNTPAPTPPVHAARLSALLKSLASAEGAVSESIKARESLIGGLEQLLETNRTALASEQSQHYDITRRKTTVEAKKRDVEDGIMRGLSADNGSLPLQNKSTPGHPSNGTSHETLGTAFDELERPQIEEITPPPVESLTPVGTPLLATEARITTTTGADVVHEHQPNHTEPPPAIQPPLYPAAGSDLLSSLSMPPIRQYAGSPTNGGTVKRRKIEPDFGEYEGGDAMADLDEDVAELLRAESGGH